MKSKKRYWVILLEQHNKVIYKAKRDESLISERKLIEFIKALLSKYALSDDEILEQFVRIPFKRKTDYIVVNKSISNLNELLSINYHAQLADYSITVSLVE